MLELLTPQGLYSLLPRGALTSLLCAEPSARNYFINALVWSLLKEGKRVFYFDMDSYFTSSIMKKGHLPENLSIIYPKGGEIDDAFVTLLSWTKPRFDLLVIDSVTTFYHVYPIRKFSAKNRKIGFYLALFREFAKMAASPVLATSHKIFRKVGEDWTTGYSGGRVLDYHSTCVILASIVGDSLMLEVKRGYRSRGNRFELPLTQIATALESLHSQNG